MWCFLPVYKLMNRRRAEAHRLRAGTSPIGLEALAELPFTVRPDSNGHSAITLFLQLVMNERIPHREDRRYLCFIQGQTNIYSMRQPKPWEWDIVQSIKCSGETISPGLFLVYHPTRFPRYLRSRLPICPLDSLQKTITFLSTILLYNKTHYPFHHNV